MVIFQIKTPPIQAPFSSATAKLVMGTLTHMQGKSQNSFPSSLQEAQNRSHPIAILPSSTASDPRRSTPHTDLAQTIIRGQLHPNRNSPARPPIAPFWKKNKLLLNTQSRIWLESAQQKNLISRRSSLQRSRPAFSTAVRDRLLYGFFE